MALMRKLTIRGISIVHKLCTRCCLKTAFPSNCYSTTKYEGNQGDKNCETQSNSIFKKSTMNMLDNFNSKLHKSELSGIEATLCIFKRKYSSESDNQSDSDSEDVKLVLQVVSSKSPPGHVHIVPGKGPPPEPPVDCCMSGCANCVWIQYADELKRYFTAEQGLQKAKEAIEEIDNPGLKMFLKLELGLL